MANQIGVSEFIRQLRSDLESAIDEGEGKRLRFGVEELDLELQVAASLGAEVGAKGKAGVKLWVLSAEGGTDGKATYQSSRTQTVRVKLRPKRRIENQDGDVEYVDDVLLSANPTDHG